MRKTLIFPLIALLVSCGGSSSDSSGDQDTGIDNGDSTSGSDSTGSDTSTNHDGSSDTTSSGDSTSGSDTTTGDTSGGGAIKTVFLILMENHNWSDILGSSSAPYINHTLLPASASTKQYFNPPGIHPSEPNYLWLEAGSNLGITNDSNPSSNHQSTTDHLVTQLEGKGVTWKSYQEDIDGKTCPLTSVGQYAPKHNPMVFFDDVTETNKTTAARCIAHVRPYTEFLSDLSGGKAAQYNFVTPNLCDDMHGAGGCPSDEIKAGDDWLSTNVPKILASAQFKDNGALFITWDEGEGGDGPIGMIVLSPLAKAGGYTNSIHYDHSSMLKTVEEIFGVPLLRGAADASTNDLADLFNAGAIP